MKHTIDERRYRKNLDRLDFTIDDRYFCETYLMEEDNYCLRIYDLKENRNELYSNWFDSDLCWVTGNEEQYTIENIQPIIDEAYKIISNYIGVQYTN